MTIKGFLMSHRIGHVLRFLARYDQYVGRRRELTYFPDKPQKSAWRIFLDQLTNVRKYGYVNDDYYIYGHDVQDAAMSGYMMADLHEKIISDYNRHPYGHNVGWALSYDYRAVVRDKYLFALVMESLGLPVPATFGAFSGGLFWHRDTRQFVDFDHIADHDFDVMVKPIQGCGGVGMFRVECLGGKLFIHDSKTGRRMIDSDELAKTVGKGQYLAQSFVREQHAAMASLFAGSINTLRVTMVRDSSGNIDVLGVMLLMGAGDMIVSNWHYGGVVVNVKPDGSLNEYGYSLKCKRVAQHPDTGIVFSKFIVPYYQETIDICRKAMTMLPGLKTIGWDMAITPEGPIFIEGNDMWGMPAHQMVEEHGWKDKYVKYFGYKE